MKLTTENIHRLLLQSYPDGLTVKELLLASGQKKSKKTLARKCLKNLARKALCKKINNRYFTLTKITSRKNQPDTPQYRQGRTAKRSTYQPSKSKVIDEERLIFNFLHKHKVGLKFPPSVLAECKKIPRKVYQLKSEPRVDLRDLKFITIDGEEARDFDDAIYAEKDGNGYKVWVTIADVAEYVLPESKLDKEAFARGTSVYLPDRVYPMLPEVLSNGLCSLKAGLNRKTLTCEIRLDENCKPVKTKIYESLVRIAQRLSYPQVDNFLQSGELEIRADKNYLEEKLLLYDEIAQKLASQRKLRGAINFTFPEDYFIFDNAGKVKDVKKKFQTRSNRLIEQFMLEANENIGKFCELNGLPILWRNHAPPPKTKIDDLKALFWHYREKVPKLTTGLDFNRVLAKVRSTPYRDILNYSLLRVMSQACYETHRIGHFGLAATHYCHFTSPIRRYPDLLVHRALKNHLHQRRENIIFEFVPLHCSRREREAVMVERKSSKLKKALLMQDKTGTNYPLKVSGLHWKGIFVEIEHPYVEGFLPYRTMEDDHYIYDETAQLVSGERKGRKISYGDSLNGTLQRIDWKNMCPEFSWNSW
jgi:ribonuclease R